jgi:zinc transport system substrate-binding protein
MRKNSLILILVIAGSLIFFGCQNRRRADSKEKSTISVSILPQKYLIDRITNSSIEVNVMVPPGTSPEMYEPSPVQMKGVANSVVYFAIGPLEFERTILTRIKELNPGIRFVDLSTGINLMEGHKHREIMGEDEHHTNFDPHIWTSTLEFKLMASKTFDVLCELFPKNRKLYLENLLVLNEDINKLDSAVKEVVNGAATKNFLIYHPALSYFARDFGLNQIAIEEDGKNPSAQNLINLVKLAKSQKINTIFIQAQFDSRNAEMLAWELGGEVMKIDPLGYDWLKNMYDLKDKLTVALRSNITAKK